MAQAVKNPPAMWETWVQSLGQEDPPEKEWQPTPGTLACRIPWTEEPGGLESTGSQESDKTERLTHTHISFIPSSTEKEEILASNIARHLSTLKHTVVGQG